MGELKNIVFNPTTGLFEDSTNPNAHLMQHEVHKERNQRPKDPMAAQFKPVIRSLYYLGNLHPMEGTTFSLSWEVEKAQRVVVTFPSGNTVEFPPVCNCQFVVPSHDFRVRLVAYNGKYSTQRTLSVSPRRHSIIHRFLKLFD
ncbi:MAG: hypothetical protein IJ650_07175 [Paludibacteraceae bacterium]|nr:hypothetical protein [Paludibacteraceae bacterium]